MFDFIYLHKLREERKPSFFINGYFEAVSLTSEQLKQFNYGYDVNLFPIIPMYGEKEMKETFIHGIGYVKLKKKNIVKVPLYDYENEEDWDEYLNKYGRYCLYYSLTGHDYLSPACCEISAQAEFRSLVNYKIDIKRYQTYVYNVKQIQQIQRDILYKTYKFDKYKVDKCLFYPMFYIQFSWCTCSPYLNTLSDDSKLEMAYRMIRCKEMSDNGLGIVKNAIDICSILHKEIEEGVKFPICMKDRIKKIYGERCAEFYQSILDEFKV